MHRNTWRLNLIDHFNYDPILCECGHLMKKTYRFTPIRGKDDEWHKTFFGEPEPFKKANWEHFIRYCQAKY